MSSTSFMHDSDSRRPPLRIEAALQQIASAAHLRGVLVVRGVKVEVVPARDLMRALRGAWEGTADSERRRDQVEGIIRGTATRLAHGGPVTISGQLFGIAKAYAKPKGGTA
jgi:hypothetical protein